ncbi:MAG: hypothetical protein QM528_05910 [Phycisphaerales bacterium]|nr:hypothetical protein [Phycisphaerales bacterium]
MERCLIILAAGMASRYGGKLKQMDAFGPSGETLMEYSLFDALSVGFKKFVFVIREEFADDFKKRFSKCLAGKNVEVAYVYQNLNVGIKGTPKHNRKKPWGTGHALLCCKDVVHQPFAIINADDYYGKEGVLQAYNFLQTNVNKQDYAIIGYPLENTLSSFGTVSRGICYYDENNHISRVEERTKVLKKGEHIIFTDSNNQETVIPPGSFASMNLFCFTTNIFGVTEKLFDQFYMSYSENINNEFYLANIINEVITKKIGRVSMIPCRAHWFGVTYPDDAQEVKNHIIRLVQNNLYPKKLW